MLLGVLSITEVRSFRLGELCASALCVLCVYSAYRPFIPQPFIPPKAERSLLSPFFAILPENPESVCKQTTLTQAFATLTELHQETGGQTERSLFFERMELGVILTGVASGPLDE